MPKHHDIKERSPRIQRSKHTRLTPPEKEAFIQTWLVLKNVSAACKAHGISRPTGDKLIKSYKASVAIPEQLQREENALASLRNRTYDITNELLDSIRPEDMESGRLPIRNAQGEVVGYKEFGPSLLQKATSFGIMVDKIKIQHDLERAADTDARNGTLMMPDSVEQLQKAITGQIKSLQLLQINIKDEAPDLSTRVDAAMEIEAEVTTTQDDDPVSFDNP